MSLKRLAIISTHPIQYNAPLFEKMNEESKEFTIKVFYTWSQAQKKVDDRDFGISIKWDVPLLGKYDYVFVENTSSNPGSHHFNGIVNPTLIQQIENWRPHAILIFGWSFVSHLKAIRHFHNKIPVLFRGDSTLLDEPKGLSFKTTLRRTFLHWLYKHVDYALYVGSENKKYFQAHGLKDNQLIFAPHAVDINRFSINSGNDDKKARDWKKNMGINGNAIVILFAGKLTDKKDSETLIRSFLEIENEDLWLIIVGNGKEENRLKTKYQNRARIVFMDFQNQSLMPLVYRTGDIFVLPSKGPGETWGLSINEAMASSRAVIASDKCGCSSDLIIEGSNGYVFKNGDIESLKNSIVLATKDFKQLGLSSYELIQKWNYSKTITELDRLFESKAL